MRDPFILGKNGIGGWSRRVEPKEEGEGHAVNISAIGRVYGVDVGMGVNPNDACLIVCSVVRLSERRSGCSSARQKTDLSVPEIVPIAKEWSPPRVTGS